MEKPRLDRSIRGAELLALFPPVGVFFRLMGSYGKGRINQRARTEVTHLRGFGGPVRYADHEELILKVNVMECIAAMQDPPEQPGLVKSALQGLVSRLGAKS